MRRRFTLIEILTVLAIVAVVLGVVLPRVTRIPKRLAVEGARTSFVSVLRECSVRAVASGRTIQARLDASGTGFVVTAAPAEKDALSDSKLPDGSSGEPEDAVPGLVVPNQSNYSLPSGVAWDDESLPDPDNPPVFTFYADGSASGPDLVYVVAKRRFLLAVDRLTGRPEIRELQE